MSFYYQIYGLKVASSRNISLLEQAVNGNETDISVTWGTSMADTTDEIEWVKISNDDTKVARNIVVYSAPGEKESLFKLAFFTDNILLTLIFDKSKQTARIVYNENETEGNLDSYFVGVIMGCIMRLQGMICLHGSAVNIAGKAAVFLGSKRSGKSTTAAAFAQMGFSVLADDITVIRLRKGRYYVQPGYPKVRLRPASLSALHQANAGEFKLVHTQRNSRYSDITDTFQRDELPLDTIYILNQADITEPYIEPAPGDGLVDLIRNSFAKYLSTGDIRKTEFQSLSQLANMINVKTLNIPRDLAGLNAQCQLVINDLSLVS
jgi:hypothetical protein